MHPAILLLVVGACTLVFGSLLAAIMLPALARARESARRATCLSNLKEMGYILKMYATESNGGMFPPLSPVYGELCPAMDRIPSDYMPKGKTLVCPSDPTVTGSADPSVIGDASYFYLGYAVTNETEGRAFIEAYRKQRESGGGFEEDLKVEAGFGTGGGDRIVRLHEGIEDELPVRQDQIPVMFDRSYDHHVVVNVVYMDGHVEMLGLGEQFPAQMWFLDALADFENN